MSRTGDQRNQGSADVGGAFEVVGEEEAEEPDGLIFAAAVILCLHITMDGLVPQISVIAENFPDWKSWALFAGAFIVTFFFKANPIYVILAGGILGLLIY